MGFVTPCLVLLFVVVVVSGKSAAQEDVSTTVAPKDTADRTTESEDLKTAETTDNAAAKDGDDTTDGEITLEDLLLFGNLFGDVADAVVEKGGPKPGDNKRKSDDIASDSTNLGDSKLVTGSDGIRRQGEVNPSFNQNSEVQYDDAKQDSRSNLPYSQNSQNFNRDNIQDEAIELQLTDGGYNKPFAKIERPSNNNRFASLSDSSQQSEKMLGGPDRSSSRQQRGRQILPQATYPIPPQFPFTPFRPMFHPALESSGRNILPVNPAINAPNGLINTPPARYPDYRTAGFQAQFPSPAPGVFSNFGQDPNNAAMFQTSQRNPFQDTSLIFQSAPQVQPQPILIDPSGNLPPQFQQDPLSAFSNFDNVDDNSGSNYAAFFGDQAGNPQFQVPPNFFGPNLNRVNVYNSPPVSFLPAIANSQERLPVPFTRYIPSKDTQNQQNVNDQQPESEASQEEKTTSTDSQDGINAGNNNDELPFGTRLQDKDDTDVYIRYPTNEAGYAVEENLPPRNNSGDAKMNDKQSETEQRNIDPYRNALNLLQSSQRINSTFGFPPPPPIFRDAPINFGYQSPQNPIMIQYPDRNRDLPNFVRPDFSSGNPFNILASLPENNYGFPRRNTQGQGSQETAEVPSCAKQNNVSFCFEDSEYPSNAILFSLNSNSFVADQLSGSDQLLNSVSLVEKNSSVPDQTTENYACPVDIKYGSPMRAKNVAGNWRIIISLEGKFWQSVRLEVCKSLGDPCKYADSKVKTSCVQKYSVQRFMVWSPSRGVFSDLFKLPVACSCQILDENLP